MPLLSDAQAFGTAKPRLLSDDEALAAPIVNSAPSAASPRLLSDDEMFGAEAVLQVLPPPRVAQTQPRLLSDEAVLTPPNAPSPPLYFGPNGEPLSQSEKEQLFTPKPPAPELTLPEKISTAIQKANEDPVGAFSGSVGRIAGRLGVPQPERLARDIYAGIHSLGPLGAEFAGAGKTLKPSAAPKSAAPIQQTAKAEVPTTVQTPTMAQTAPEVAGADRAGNINLNRIYAPEDVKEAIRQTAARNDEFIGARRGVITHDQTVEMASLVGMTPQKLATRVRGQAFNAEEMFAARNLLVGQATKVKDLAKVAHGGSDLDKAGFAEELTRLVAIQEHVSGATAEAGRTLSQFRMMAGASKEQITRLVEASKAGGLDDILDKVATLDDPAKVAQFASTAYKAKTSDMMLEAWINALLSGPTTHATNILSNSLVSLWALPETALASGISKFTGSGIRGREVMARAFGILEGAKDGIRAGWRTFKTEEPSDLAGKIEVRKYRAIPSVNVGGMELGGKQVRIPGRLLMAEDEFFKSIGYRQEINAQAMRQALNEGLKGKALAARISELKGAPTEAMATAARNVAERQTFTNPLGKFGQQLMAMTREVPALRIVMPFIRTPVNIVKFAAERSPFAPLFKEVRANLAGTNGAVARDTQIARIGLGSAVSAATVYAAMEGAITGSGPVDARERGLKYASGWQPYSLKVGENFYSYGRLEPLGMLLGVAADFAELSTAMSDEEQKNIASLIMGSVQKNLVSKTWLRGLSDMIEAFQDPERYGAQYIQNLAGTLVPTAVAQYARTQDPYLREARTVLDKLKDRIPGLRETLPMRRDILGEPIKLEGALGPDILSPIYQSAAVNDPAIAEMLRLKVAPSKPTRKIRGVELEAEEYDALQEATGRVIRRGVQTLVGLPQWNGLLEEDKRELLEEAIRKSRDVGRATVLTRFPELALRIAHKKHQGVAQNQ